MVKILPINDRILAVSSGGGHWVELIRLSPAFSNSDIAFATVYDSYRKDLESFSNYRFYTVMDVTRWNKFKWIISALQLLFILMTERPKYIISTGALPGYIAIRLGKIILGSKTIWIDSIANVDQLSKAGEHVGKYADLWLTQWEHLARDNGPFYGGAIL
jgi:UDP-N-acetylglucosamine:LPS N-acetylglucosamine transferase